MGDEYLQPNPELGLLNQEALFFDLEGLDDEQRINAPLGRYIPGLALPQFVTSVPTFFIESSAQWAVTPTSATRTPRNTRQLEIEINLNPESPIYSQFGLPPVLALKSKFNLQWNRFEPNRYRVQMFQIRIAYLGPESILHYPGLVAEYRHAVLVINELERRKGSVFLKNGEIDYFPGIAAQALDEPKSEREITLGEFKFASTIYDQVLQPVVGFFRNQIKNAPPAGV